MAGCQVAGRMIAEEDDSGPARPLLETSSEGLVRFIRGVSHEILFAMYAGPFERIAPAGGPDLATKPDIVIDPAR